MKISGLLSVTALVSSLFIAPAQAQSLVDGVYFSAAEENGRGACALTITSLGEEHKYGDQLFKLESSGEGACEWSAIGLSKNYNITAGSVTSGGIPTFVKLTFPFGPAGKRIELTAFDADGALRNTVTFLQGELTGNTAE